MNQRTRVDDSDKFPALQVPNDSDSCPLFVILCAVSVRSVIFSRDGLTSGDIKRYKLWKTPYSRGTPGALFFLAAFRGTRWKVKYFGR